MCTEVATGQQAFGGELTDSLTRHKSKVLKKYLAYFWNVRHYLNKYF